ncbi:MAG TPA: response regulator transcription factor [Pseudonocardiaceae bacterium]
MSKLVLASDHWLFVDALATLLVQRGFVVAGIADAGTAVIEVVGRHRPDVCVLDRPAVSSNISANVCTDSVLPDPIGRIRSVSPETKVLVLTPDHDGPALGQALRGGAVGLLRRSCGIDTLTGAIDRIMRGELVIDLPTEPVSRRGGEAADAHRLAAYLTCRERECLALLVEGLGTTAMAKRLGVSTMTVRSHVQALLTKLGVHSRLAAASYAVRHGLLNEVAG